MVVISIYSSIFSIPSHFSSFALPAPHHHTSSSSLLSPPTPDFPQSCSGGENNVKLCNALFCQQLATGVWLAPHYQAAHHQVPVTEWPRDAQIPHLALQQGQTRTIVLLHLRAVYDAHLQSPVNHRLQIRPCVCARRHGRIRHEGGMMKRARRQDHKYHCYTSDYAEREGTRENDRNERE